MGNLTHKLGHFVAGEKVGHFVRWDNLSPEKCKLNNGFLIYMPEILPKIAQDISQICPRYAQALPEVWGFKLRKWDKMSPGRVHKLGHYVAGEVHNAVGHFVVGTKCLLTFPYLASKYLQYIGRTKLLGMTATALYEIRDMTI